MVVFFFFRFYSAGGSNEIYFLSRFPLYLFRFTASISLFRLSQRDGHAFVPPIIFLDLHPQSCYLTNGQAFVPSIGFLSLCPSTSNLSLPTFMYFVLESFHAQEIAVECSMYLLMKQFETKSPNISTISNFFRHNSMEVAKANLV